MADAFTSETYNALCRDAEGYLARGLAEQARELLLKATSLIGTRPRARSLLADACMQLGLWGEAKSQLEALSTLEVDNIYTHFRLGQVLEETGEAELARDNFRVVLDMNPDHHGAKVALARLEKETAETTPEKKAPPPEGQQIFADSDDTESIFAGEGSEGDGVDDLLNNIGLGDKREVEGVEDLLNSIGINEEKKKEETSKVDFGAIFGGASHTPEPSEPEEQSPLASVFGSGESELPESHTDLNSIFGYRAATEETEPEPEDKQEKDTAEEESGTDLNAIFGALEPEAPAEEPAAEEETPEEEKAESGTDLNAIFGAPEAAEEKPEEAPAEEPVDEKDASRDEPAEIRVEVPVFPEEETEPQAAEAPEAPAEEPAAEEEPPEEEESGTDLNAIFGAPEAPEAPAEEPVAEEEPAAEEKTSEEEETGTDLNAIFGASETSETDEETAPEASDIPEAPAEEPAAEEEAPEEPEAPAEEPAPEPGALAPTDSKAGEDAEAAVEYAAGGEEASEEETGEVTEPGSLAPTDSMAEEEPPVEDQTEEETGYEESSYHLLPGDCSSLCTLKLDSGGVRVLGGMLAAVSGTIELEDDILTGKGFAWLGQGDLMPVVVEYTGGMTVRIDRLALRPRGVSSVSYGLESVPALRKLEGEDKGSLLLFINGRLKKLSVSPGLRVRGESILAADPGVTFTEAKDGFLAVAGTGRVIIAG